MSTVEIPTGKQGQQTDHGFFTVRVVSTTWGPVPQVEHTYGGTPGYGARLAVRKFGAALNKLATQ